MDGILAGARWLRGDRDWQLVLPSGRKVARVCDRRYDRGEYIYLALGDCGWRTDLATAQAVAEKRAAVRLGEEVSAVNAMCAELDGFIAELQRDVSAKAEG